MKKTFFKLQSFICNRCCKGCKPKAEEVKEEVVYWKHKWMLLTDSVNYCNGCCNQEMKASAAELDNALNEL